MDLAEQWQDKLPPFTKLLGMRLRSVAPERVIAELVVRQDLCTLPDVAHGGALMAFADTLGALATIVNLPPGATTTTLESKTNFFAPAAVGTTVIGESEPLHRGRRTMVWQTRHSGDHMTAWTERVTGPEVDMTLTWRDFDAPFMVEYLKEQSATGAHEMFSLFVPARAAEVMANGVRGQGVPTIRDQFGKQGSTAFLAFSETWVKV